MSAVNEPALGTLAGTAAGPIDEDRARVIALRARSLQSDSGGPSRLCQAQPGTSADVHNFSAESKNHCLRFTSHAATAARCRVSHAGNMNRIPFSEGILRKLRLAAFRRVSRVTKTLRALFMTCYAPPELSARWWVRGGRGGSRDVEVTTSGVPGGGMQRESLATSGNQDSRTLVRYAADRATEHGRPREGRG